MPLSDDATADAIEQQRVLLHMPVDVRNLALVVVAVLASLFALSWAQEVVVPVLLGAMISYALSPLVDRLEQHAKLPRAAGAGVVVVAVLAALGWGLWALSDDAAELVDSLPQVAQKVRQTVSSSQQRAPGTGTLERVQQAANELERAAIETASPASAASAGAVATQRRAQQAAQPTPEAPPRGPEGPRFNLRDYLWTTTLGLITLIGQTIVVVFIVFFQLAAGNTFRRKMVKLAGPKLSQKKITVQALDEIHDQIRTYLVVQVALSVLVGILTWLAFWAIGLNQPGVWGVVAGITNLIPYLGSVIVGAASTVVGLVQFEAIDKALLVGGASFGIHTVVGNLLTPWLTGRTNRMNPFVVFVAVLLFGWLWGIVGLILGVPILVVIKTVCDRVDELKPVAELIGG